MVYRARIDSRQELIQMIHDEFNDMKINIKFTQWRVQSSKDIQREFESGMAFSDGNLKT